MIDYVTFDNSVIYVTQDVQPDPKFVNIIKQIQGFSYSVKNGYFIWTYQGNLEVGMMPYPVMSAKFNDFQQRIIDQRPTTFDELEAFLS